MKILYALGNHRGNHLQLNRFLRVVKDQHTVKVSAYHGQNYECNIDWTLDALCDLYTNEYHQGLASFIYEEQIKAFAPDLVISDFEPITSNIAYRLNIKLWQVSSLFIHYGCGGIGLPVIYPKLFDQKFIDETKHLVSISNRVFICSHLGDLSVPIVKSGIQWVRPYHEIGSLSEIGTHNVVAVHIDANKRLIDRLKQTNDSILFTEYTMENHPITIKYLQNDDYANNLQNANKVIMYACESLLADAFYNRKMIWMIQDFTSRENIMVSSFNEYLSLGKTLLSSMTVVEILPDLQECPYQKDIRFLDEYLGENNG